MSISCGPPCSGWRAGMAAAALPDAVGWGCGGAGAGSGFLPSSSRMSAPSPRPSAFLAIMDHLLGQMRVALCPPATRVIKNDRLSEAWCFRQPDVARDDALENLWAEESAQVAGDLAGKRGPIVVHRQQNAFDLQVRVQCAANAHQGIQQFGDAFQGQVFALNWN